MRVTIKWRFVLKFAAVVTVAGVAVALVHQRQVRGQVGAFLRQADRAKETAAEADAAGNSELAGEQRDREESFLRRYLLARPDDVDARERLGRLMLRTAKTGRQVLEAHLALEEALRRDPARDELRRFVIDLILDPRLGLFDPRFELLKDAERHLQTLLAKKPDDGELEGLLARVAVYGKRFDGKDGAEEWFERSVAHRPDLVESSLGLAYVRRIELKKAKEADEAVAAMLKANPDKFRALLGAARYLREFNLPQLAVGKDVATPDGLVTRARGLAPDELDVLLAAAELNRSRARLSARDPKRDDPAAAFAEARKLLERAVELHPKQPAAYLALASLEAETRQPADALAVVRRGLGALPESADLLVSQLEYQFLTGDAAGASATLEKLKATTLTAEVAEFQRVRVLALQEKWAEVAPALERLIPSVQTNPDLLRRVNLLLGRCYEQLGEHQKRLAAYEAVLNRPTPLPTGDQLWGPAMLGVAEAQVALGQADRALKTYRDMAATRPFGFVAVARLELLRALREPDEKKRDWKPVEGALAEAEAAAAKGVLPDLTETRLLRALATHYQKGPAEARKQLEALAAERPKESAVRVELAMQGVREGDRAKALAALDAAEKDLGDSPEVRLARAGVWAAGADADLAAKLTGLAAGAEKFGRAGQQQLLRGLAEVASRAGGDGAGKLWDELARVRPHDLGVQLVRFDRASRAGDAAAMGQILDQIVRIDGEGGPSARMARAALLVRQSQDAKDPAALRDQALAILDGLEREQVGPPLIGRVVLGQALIQDANGNRDAAAEKYSQAAALGETNPEAQRRLVELLAQRGRLGEARELLGRLQQAADSPDLQRLGAELSLRLGKGRDALDQALKAVKDSKKPEDQLYLGVMYWVAGREPQAQPDFRKEAERNAEAHFRRAIELKPEAADGWLALVECLVALDRKDEAAKTFEQAREKVARPERALFTAVGYARLGEPQKAADAYKQARTENPNDAAVALAEANFLFRLGRLADARDGFRRVAAMPSAPADARAAAQRQLAVATAADPDYETSRQAVELMPATPAGNETPAGRRQRAVILALQRDRRHKLEAIRLLTENTQGRTPDEHFLLAQLHNQVGNRTQVRVELTNLLREDRNRIPLYVGYFAGWLLRENDPAGAAEWVAVMEKLDRDSLQTAELKARLAAARKNLPAARAALLPKADAPNAPVGLIARVCEDVGLYDEAEQLLKRFAEENRAKRPETVLALAAFYGRRGRTAEALRVWDEARSRLPADLAPTLGAVAVDVLYNTPTPKPQEVDGVVRWLGEAAGKAQGAARAALQQLHASARNLQGDHAATAKLYAEAVAANPRDALARNNLAFLLSAHARRHDEALGHVAEARKVIGDNPELLDTEALIRLEKGEVDAAVKLLEVVVVEAPSGSAYFHLARAHDAADKKDEARRAWRRAHELGLKPSDLHPLELRGYDALKNKYN